MHNGKPFTDVLGEIEGGGFLAELTAAQHAVMKAVMDTRKAGKLKIALSYTPTGKGTVRVDADFAASEPEHDRPATMFFVDADGQLVREDPRQPKLPLQAVPDDRSDPIKVGE